MSSVPLMKVDRLCTVQIADERDLNILHGAQGEKNANRRFNGIRQDVDAVSQKGPPSAHFLGEACSGRLQSQVTSWRDCSESGTLPLESGG